MIVIHKGTVHGTHHRINQPIVQVCFITPKTPAKIMKALESRIYTRKCSQAISERKKEDYSYTNVPLIK